MKMIEPVLGCMYLTLMDKHINAKVCFKRLNFQVQTCAKSAHSASRIMRWTLSSVYRWDPSLTWAGRLNMHMTAAGLLEKLAARPCDWWDGWLLESPLRTALSSTPALRVINLTVAQAELTIKRTERLMVERCPRWEREKERRKEWERML